MKKFYLIGLILTFLSLNSCSAVPKNTLPEILTAQYEIKTHSATERGYEIFLVINNFPQTVKIKGIILKSKCYDKIMENRMSENEIFIDQYFPLNSQEILNFIPPATDSRPDGIIFDIDGKEIFKEINFKLKQ